MQCLKQGDNSVEVSDMCPLQQGLSLTAHLGEENLRKVSASGTHSSVK